MKINYLIIHHSAVSRTLNSKQFTAIDNYHKNKGWGIIGYHYLIEPDGEIRVGRNETTEGAHTIGHNQDSLGICLTGNFDIEMPTPEQTKYLTKLLKDLKVKYPDAKITYHRQFANKTCPGKLIVDEWADNLFNNNLNIIKTNNMKLTINNGNQYLVDESSKFGWSINNPEVLEEVKKHFTLIGQPLVEAVPFDPTGYFIVYGSNLKSLKEFFNII